MTATVDTTVVYADVVLGDRPGFLAVAFGHDPYHDDAGKYRHRQWTERRYRWPDERGALHTDVSRILAAGERADVYVCPAVRHTDDRRKGSALPPMVCWADLDGPAADPDLLTRLDPLLVESGSDGHRHVYLPLSRPVDLGTHARLNQALAARPGGDAKWSDEALLRLPGSLNHKTDPPAVVTPLSWSGRVWEPGALAGLLGMDLSTGASKAPAPVAGKPVSDPLPALVRRAFDHPEVADRSAAHHRLVGACHRAGLTIGQTLTLAGRYPPSRDKYGDRLADEVARSWSAVDTAGAARDGIYDLIETQPASRPVTLADALGAFRRWLDLSDPAPVYLTAAAVVANLAPGDPVWLLLVAPPSSGKTEVLGSITSLPYVHPIATVTESALLSGTSRRERAKDATGGVLRSVGEFGIVLCKDFTSVLSQNKDTARAALAALREVYDGSWHRAVGTDGGRVLSWRGKCGLIGGVTPSLDRYAGVVTALGDRYVLLRLPDADAAAMSARALDHLGSEPVMRAELAEAMTGLITGADPAKVTRPLSEDERAQLTALATYTARARTAVERDGYTGEVLVMPQPEGTGRIVLQLRRLYGGLDALGVPDAQRWALLRRVARDCVPAVRTALITALVAASGPVLTSTLSRSVDMVTKTARRHLEDLALLRMVDRAKLTKARTDTQDAMAEVWNAPDQWSATPWLREFWPAEGGTEKNHHARMGIEERGSDQHTGTPPRTSLPHPETEPRCTTCGQPLLLRVEGRTQCERCRLKEEQP